MTAPTTSADVAVRILHVPNCPNVDKVRQLVQRSLAALGLSATIEELDGPCSSPTVFINGLEVDPGPGGSDESCRLDLPTSEAILASLRSARRS